MSVIRHRALLEILKTSPRKDLVSISSNLLSNQLETKFNMSFIAYQIRNVTKYLYSRKHLLNYKNNISASMIISLQIFYVVLLDSY